ncbi:MAG: hypothetical protein ACP5JJ_13795, partial [Anaerolineae bacterium]
FNHFLWEMREVALEVAGLFLEDKETSRAALEQQEAPEGVAAAVELGLAQLEERVGTYFNARRAALRAVTCNKGRLQFQGYDLVPLSETEFFFEVEPQTRVAFISAADGAVVGVKTITSSGDYGYDRVAVVAPTAEVLAEYEGRYYSPELDITWTLVAQDDHLVAQRRKYMDSKLTSVFVDAFSDDWGPLMGYPTTYLVLFERDGRGTVTGLRVSGDRVRHLWFIKQPD